jgi:transposase-like protein
VERNAKQELSAYVANHGQALLPMLELIDNAQATIDELMGDAARALVEQLLVLSAEEVAGPKRQGRAGGAIGWHGMQRGRIALAERGLIVKRPRLRAKGKPSREIAVPAYERLRAPGRQAERIRDILVAGVSTRQYANVLPRAAASVGISRSAVSRKFVAASAAQLAALNERRWDATQILAIYIDGIVVDRHHVVAAIGVDEAGAKHLLGLSSGATENASVVKDLLVGLIARGLAPERAYLFVIDGSKALRSAIEALFGEHIPVQRCRTHKVRNVVERLPKPLAAQVKAVMHAAYRLDHKEGMAKLRQQAKWLQAEHPDAAASLLEGLEETFTVNRLGLPASLRRCLASTNVIENPNGAVRRAGRRVTRYRDTEMAMRWAAAGFLEAEKRFRKIQGVRELWVLSAALGRETRDARVDRHHAAA